MTRTSFVFILMSLLLVGVGCRSTSTGEAPRGDAVETGVAERPLAEETVLGLPVMPGATRVESMTRVRAGSAVYESDATEEALVAWHVRTLGDSPVVRRLTDRKEHVWEGVDSLGSWVIRAREVPERLKGRPFMKSRSLVFLRPGGGTEP
jgi:hypothetical protein